MGFSHSLIHCPCRARIKTSAGSYDSSNHNSSTEKITILTSLDGSLCPRRDSNPGQSLSFYSYKTIKDCPSQGDVVRRTIGSFYSRKGFMLDRYTTGAILLEETYCPFFRRKKIFCRTKDLRGYIFS